MHFPLLSSDPFPDISRNSPPQKKNYWTPCTSQVERLQGRQHADRRRQRMKSIVLEVQHLQHLKTANVDVGQRAHLIAMYVQNLTSSTTFTFRQNNESTITLWPHDQKVTSSNSMGVGTILSSVGQAPSLPSPSVCYNDWLTEHRSSWWLRWPATTPGICSCCHCYKAVRKQAEKCFHQFLMKNHKLCNTTCRYCGS